MRLTPTSLRSLLVSGFLTWLIPFLVSIPLIGSDGLPRLPIGLFKSVMVVVGSIVGAWLLVRLFRQRPAFRHPGLMIGGLWLLINVALDLLILVPLTHMRLTDYFGEIALRYLVIPVMAVAIEAAGRVPAGAP